MKRIIYLGIAVLVVVLLWTGAWFFIANEVRKNVVLLADADGVATPKLSCGTLDVGGYPFHFNLDCENAEITNADQVIKIAGVRASVQVYQPTFMLASAKSPVTIEDSFTGSKSAVNWSGLQASIRLDGWRIARISVIGDDIVWNDTLAGENLIAKSPKVEFHLIDIPEQHDAKTGRAALALYTKAADAVIPGFAITDGTAEIGTDIIGLPDDVRRFGEPDILRQIQQAGGKLSNLTVDASDTDASTLNAAGELSLDPRGLLEGKLDVTSKGVADRVSPLIDAPFRAIVLGNPDADGVSHQKLSAKAGAIYSGIIPVGAVLPAF
ncbi:DUF2125 domain-containing protein [Devosia sp.]|uniref:DUF2125 domain-containing protein n=1 Tax=Devosia sp. TaxID=1871048 RepID=UPI0032644039